MALPTTRTPPGALRPTVLLAVMLGLPLGALHGQASAPRDAGEPRSPVLASFVGGEITVADLAATIAGKAPALKARIAAPGGKKALLDRMVTYDLLALEAARRGYAENPLVRDAHAHALIAAMELGQLWVDPEQLAAADVRKRYERDSAKYNRPAMRRASHIELASAEEARALIVELADGGADRFAALAGERSLERRGKRQGGELGYFTIDGKGRTGKPLAVPREIVAAVFEHGFPAAAGPSLIPRPVPHAGRFSVVMVLARREAARKLLADMEAEIRETLAKEGFARSLKVLEKRLRQQHKPEVHYQLMQAIVLDASPLGIPSGFPAAPPDPRAPSIIVEPDGV